MTLLRGDPIDPVGRWVGVQEAVHDGDAPSVHRDLAVLHSLVVTDGSILVITMR